MEMKRQLTTRRCKLSTKKRPRNKNLKTKISQGLINHRDHQGSKMMETLSIMISRKKMLRKLGSLLDQVVLLNSKMTRKRIKLMNQLMSEMLSM